MAKTKKSAASAEHTVIPGIDSVGRIPDCFVAAFGARRN
jgi:hypothetical protein